MAEPFLPSGNGFFSEIDDKSYWQCMVAVVKGVGDSDYDGRLTLK